MNTFKIIEFYFLFINALVLIKSETITNIDSWTPELLYNYTKEAYLSSDNPNKNINLKYMILDPEHYLKKGQIEIIENKLKNLYEKINITIFISLISHIDLDQEKNNDINDKIKRFVSYFNYLIYKHHNNYTDEMSLSTVFFIKDRKMRMRTGKLLRNIINDNIALDILNKRKDDLRKKDYFKVIDGLIDDIIKEYTNTNYFKRIKDKISITIWISIFLGLFLYNKINCNPESSKEKKIKEFLRKNKNQNIKKVFNESCIICLENFNHNNKEEIISTLECGHQFHEKCIVEWLKKNDKCPLCRIKMKLDRSYNNYSVNSNYSYSIYDIDVDIVDIQRDAYPGELSESQGKRIISDYNKSNRDRDNDRDSDFDNFDSGAGGASSDW